MNFQHKPEGMFLKLKHSFCILLLLSSLNAFAFDVLVAKNNINYKDKVTTKDLRVEKLSSMYTRCTPMRLEDLNKDVYISTHYILKKSVICTKDVKKYEKQSVVFDFGSLQIEQEGKVIYENDNFIRIKRRDGQIEKIYKDGRIK